MTENERFLSEFNRLDCILRKKLNVTDGESAVRAYEARCGAEKAAKLRTARELRNKLVHSVETLFTVDGALTDFVAAEADYCCGNDFILHDGDSPAETMPVLTANQRAEYRNFAFTASEEEKRAVMLLSNDFAVWPAIKKRAYLDANGLTEGAGDWNYKIALAEYVRKSMSERQALIAKCAFVEISPPPFLPDVEETDSLKIESRHFSLSLQTEADGVCRVRKKIFSVECLMPVTVRYELTSHAPQKGYVVTVFAEDVARGVSVRDKREFQLDGAESVRQEVTLDLPLVRDNGTSTVFFGASVSTRGGLINRTFRQTGVKTFVLKK